MVEDINCQETERPAHSLPEYFVTLILSQNMDLFGSPDPTSSQLEQIACIEADVLVSESESENDYFPFHSPDPTLSQLETIGRLEDEMTASTSKQQGGGQQVEVSKTYFSHEQISPTFS